MLHACLELSALLREIPANAAVSVAYGNDGRGNLLDGLVVTYPDGGSYLLPAPVGSRPALRRLFPVLNGRLGTGYDANDYALWTFRYTQAEHPTRAYANCRLLCAKLWGML